MIFHDEASSDSTVIEVRCTTKIGILHRITKALAEVGLDIRHATVQTIGLEVVDTFYVRNWSGERSSTTRPPGRDRARRPPRRELTGLRVVRLGGTSELAVSVELA